MKRGTNNAPKSENDSLILGMLSSDSFLMINKKLLVTFGPEHAVFISNLLDKVKFFAEEGIIERITGWFYLTHEQQILDTNIKSLKTLRRCKKFFKNNKILETKMAGQPAKEMYRISFAILWKEINPEVPKREGLEVPKREGLFSNKTKLKEKSTKKGFLDRYNEGFPKEWKHNKPFQNALIDFIAHRKTICKITEGAIKKTVKSLSGISVEVATAALIESTLKKWQGVFPRVRCTENPQELFENCTIIFYSSPTLAKRFLDGPFQTAVGISCGSSNESELAIAMIHLGEWYHNTRQRPSSGLFEKLTNGSETERERADLWELTPTPALLIQHFIEWLEEQSWISTKSSAVYSPFGKIFKKFIQEYQHDISVDIITGRPVA